MKQIKDIKKLTSNKYLNLYELNFESDGDKYSYFLASRRKEDDLEIYKNKTDAVKAVPYVIKNNKIYVVITKEFRHGINTYIYGTPAGLVDEGETNRQAIKRELKEEIGAKVLKLKKVINSSYVSAGLTDETVECYYAKVELKYNQELGETEDINMFLLDVNKIPHFIRSNKMCLQSSLLLTAFHLKFNLKGINYFN